MSRPSPDAVSLTFEDIDACMAVCGQQDENLKRVESRLGVGVRVRGNQISLSGPDDAVERARNLL